MITLIPRFYTVALLVVCACLASAGLAHAQQANTPPMFPTIADQTVDERVLLALTLSASDADLPAQSLTFSLVSGPAGMTVSPEGQLSWLAERLPGSNKRTIRVSVSDGVEAVTNVFAVTVQEVLMREVISREVSIHVGGVQTPEIQEIVSREVSLFVLNGVEGIKEVVSREYSLVNVTPEPPPRIKSLVLTPSPSGDQVKVDWSSYDQWAVRDIREFRIYRSDKPFASVQGMDPALVISAEQTSGLLTGLPSFQDHFIAVVPVDGLTNLDLNVQYFGAYILMPEVNSREVTLFIGDEPEPPYREVISREVSLLISTPEPPPAILGLKTSHSPAGDTVELDWSSYNQWAVRDIDHFEIYFSDKPFSDIVRMTNYAFSPGETSRITLTGLPTLRDHFFAVVPVDGQGNFETKVTYAGVYILIGEVVSREVSLFVGAEPEPPYREVVSREVSIVVPNAEIPAPVTGVDSGFTVTTSLARPRALALDWSGYPEITQRDVARYQVYMTNTFFSDVSGMTPVTNLMTGTQSYTVDGLESARIYYVAVVAEDALGQFDPHVYARSGVTTPKLEMSIPDLEVKEGSSLAYFLEVTEKDLTGYDLHFGLVSGPEGLIVSNSGLLLWSPSEFQNPGLYPTTVSVTDNGIPALTATKTFNIKLLLVNRPPRLNVVPDQTVDEEQLLEVQLNATDRETPQSLAFVLLNAPAGASINPASGLIRWTPEESQGPGNFSVRARVTDPSGLSDEQSFGIKVREVNRAPVPAVIADQTIEEQIPFTLTLSATDKDIPAQQLNYELLSGPRGMVVSSAGALSWVPDADQAPSTNLVRMGVSDGTTTSTGTFTLVVRKKELPVTLTIVTGNEAGIVLSWKSSGPAYHVEAKTTLGDSWHVEPVIPEIVGENHVVRLKPSGRQIFYRLSR